MHVRNFTLLLFIALFFNTQSRAQNFCPSNVDLELGNFTNWILYTGTCCPINMTNIGQVNNRHEITSGSATDPFGGFPIVAPGSGNYSIKLGNWSVFSEAERVRYYVQVPANVNNYSLIYRYAVVFQDPGHSPAEQPRFQVRAFDSITNVTLPCAEYTYISTSNLPGFQVSSTTADVLYKSWTTATLDLSGWGGHTVAVEFSTGDCALGAHFGYGYVDMSCGLFQISGSTCGAPTTTLTAPPGFQTYTWMDSSFSTVVGSGQVTTIPTPSQTSTYRVILTPYSGFGCPDTLSTILNISNLSVHATNDTTVCNGAGIQLAAGATGNMPPFNYSWTPSTGLSCTTCANPVATVTGTTTYYLTVTDSNGCSKYDTVHITAGTFAGVTTTSQAPSCSNSTNGSATASPVGGLAPYTYVWNTTPVQTTQTATNLGAGTYTVTVTDNMGCVKTGTVTITAPAMLNATTSNTPVNCYGQNNGSATTTVTGGTSPYNYSWNTQPVQTTQTATNLVTGAYTVTITDAHGCITTSNTNVSQPAQINASISSVTNALCGSTGSASVITTGGTPAYTYSWNTQPVQTTQTASNLFAGTYTVTVTDAHGCSDTATGSIIQSSSLSVPISKTDISCNGMNNGSITANPTGGIAPYTYSWNTQPVQTTQTITNLPPGTYTVNVIDNLGCQGTVTTTITQPNVLNAFINNLTHVSCYGGSNGTAHVAVNGGTAGYTYQWNTVPAQTTPTASNLSAGTYNVTVTDANGCIDTTHVNINQPTSLEALIANSTNATCGDPNGNASSVVSGGTPPYVYSWNTLPVQTTAMANNLTGGTYTVTVTDIKGCIDTAMVSILQSPALIATAAFTNITCHNAGNGTATATISGGTLPYTYTWSNSQTTLNINNLTAGTYTFNATDNIGCIASANVTITEPAVLDASITNVNDIKCFDAHNGSANIIVTGGTQPYTYLWNNGNTQPNPTGLDAGSYTATITDARGCTDTASMQITQPTEIMLTAEVLNISCMGSAQGAAQATVTGGTAPYTYAWNSAPVQTSANATGLYPGSYTVTITDGNGCEKAANIVVDGYPLPTINAGPDQVYCYGVDQITLSASGASHYQWSPANSLSCATCAVTGANPSVTTTYEVIGTDVNNCRDTDQVMVTVYTKQAASVGADIDICKGATAQLSASGGIDYQWTPAPQSSEAASAPVVNPDSDMVYTVVIVQNQCFSDTLTQKVNVDIPPTVNWDRTKKYYRELL